MKLPLSFDSVKFNILEQIILYIEKQRRGYLAHPLFLARRCLTGKRCFVIHRGEKMCQTDILEYKYQQEEIKKL